MEKKRDREEGKQYGRKRKEKGGEKEERKKRIVPDMVTMSFLGRIFFLPFYAWSFL